MFLKLVLKKLFFNIIFNNLKNKNYIIKKKLKK